MLQTSHMLRIFSPRRIYYSALVELWLAKKWSTDTWWSRWRGSMVMSNTFPNIHHLCLLSFIQPIYYKPF